MKHILLHLFLLFCITSTAVIAAPTNDERIMQIAQSDQDEMKEVWSKFGKDGENLKVEIKANSHFETENPRLFKYDSSTGTLTFNHSNFLAATDKSRKQALKSFLTELKQSKVSESTKDNITNTLRRTSSDLSAALDPIVTDADGADAYETMRLISPITNILRLILGVALLVITLFLVTGSVLDLVYLGLPFARELMEVRSKRSGRFRFVSSAAVNSMKESEVSLDSDYKNVYVLYLKRRFWVYLFLGFTLSWIASGGIGRLIEWVLNTYFY